MKIIIKSIIWFTVVIGAVFITVKLVNSHFEKNHKKCLEITNENTNFNIGDLVNFIENNETVRIIEKNRNSHQNDCEYKYRYEKYRVKFNDGTILKDIKWHQLGKLKK